MRHVPLDQCVLLTPCRSVHTFGMKMAIDVAALDGGLRVVAVATELPPWRLFARRMLRTRCILEAGAGAFAAWGLRAGDRLALRESA